MHQKENPQHPNTRLEAVIEIGSIAIRLVIAEISKNGSWLIIDRAEQSVSLGRDVFTSGFISRESLIESLSIILKYREILNSWAIPDEQVTVVATSALREARNRDSILDRLAVKTGFIVKVIDGIEENRLMYLLVDYVLQESSDRLTKSDSVIMDVGGGSTEIMLLQKGRMVSAHSFLMGTVIIDQHVKAMMGSLKDTRRFLKEYVKTTAETLNNELDLEQVKVLIAIGNEARLVARNIGTQLSELVAEVDRNEFAHFADQICASSIEDLMRQFRLSYLEAETLIPGLLAYRLFLENTGAQKVLIPYLSIREGIIISKVSGQEDIAREELYKQVVASAQTIAKKYHYDESHVKYVTRIALKLFDTLDKEHRLDRHARLLLECAAILHDIGSYVRANDHHLHSFYLVSHSDIFGLTKEDITILANVTRYHRGKFPSQTHQSYASLPRQDRTMVLKLSALLRVADALDRGHSQHIDDFDIDIAKNTVFLRSKGPHDITLERLALDEKANMFEEIFGYSLVLL